MTPEEIEDEVAGLISQAQREGWATVEELISLLEIQICDLKELQQ